MTTMCRSLVLALAACCSSVAGCVPAPVIWSPDGGWVAWVEVVGDSRTALPPDWLAASQLRRPPAEPRASKSHHQRLWVARSDGSRPLCMADVRGLLSSPAWRNDGRALAYSR